MFGMLGCTNKIDLIWFEAWNPNHLEKKNTAHVNIRDEKKTTGRFLSSLYLPQMLKASMVSGFL